MKRAILVFLFGAAAAGVGAQSGHVSRARNVVLLLADAAGIPVINAASLYGYDAPRRLFVQHMPFIGLSETSTASEWVTDSAAGMTAIVTGTRTHNGVIAQGPDAVRGKVDGTPLKTVLDYAEEQGLSTGLITNDSVAGATPAAVYAHSNDRAKFGEIVLQAFEKRSGDGVDVLIGPARAERAAVTRIDRTAAVPLARGRPRRRPSRLRLHRRRR